MSLFGNKIHVEAKLNLLNERAGTIKSDSGFMSAVAEEVLGSQVKGTGTGDLVSLTVSKPYVKIQLGKTNKIGNFVKFKFKGGIFGKSGSIGASIKNLIKTRRNTFISSIIGRMSGKSGSIGAPIKNTLISSIGRLFGKSIFSKVRFTAINTMVHSFLDSNKKQGRYSSDGISR